MLVNKQTQNDKRIVSNKNLHRRVITEVEPPPQQPTVLNKEHKRTERVNSKPKFIDVYSKYLHKNNL